MNQTVHTPAVVVAAAIMLGLAACAGSAPGPTARLVGPSTRAVARVDASSDADAVWARLDEAVAEAAGLLLLAVERTEPLGDHWRVFHVRDSRNRPGRLDARLEGGVVELTCRIGNFGDPELERGLTRSVARLLRRGG